MHVVFAPKYLYLLRVVWKLSGGLWCTGTDAMWVWWWADSHASVLCLTPHFLWSVVELSMVLLWEWCWQLLCSSLSQCTNICMNKQTTRTQTFPTSHSCPFCSSVSSAQSTWDFTFLENHLVSYTLQKIHSHFFVVVVLFYSNI